MSVIKILIREGGRLDVDAAGSESQSHPARFQQEQWKQSPLTASCSLRSSPHGPYFKAVLPSFLHFHKEKEKNHYLQVNVCVCSVAKSC